MGRQNRYARPAIDGYELPSVARRHDLDTATQLIVDHLAETGQPGIYTAAGVWRGPIDDKLLAPMLSGPDRARSGQRVDGADTILAALPTETYADIQDRIYRARHYASPRMVIRARVADALYAAIGAGILEPVPTAQVEATVDRILQDLASGEIPQRFLAHHAQGLRAWLGLPTGEWTDTADKAARRGRAICNRHT